MAGTVRGTLLAEHCEGVLTRHDERRPLRSGCSGCRYMVLGATHLLLFRSVTLENLVNIVPISTIKFKPDSHEPTCFQLVTEKWKAYFRVVDDETAQGWHAATVEQQGRVESTLARGSQKMRHVS